MKHHTLLSLLALAACGTDRAPFDDTDAGLDAGTVDGALLVDAPVDEPLLDAPPIDPPPPVLKKVAVVVGYGSRRARSVDGTSWTNFVQVTANGSDDNDLLRGIGFGGGTFMAVGGSSDGLVFTSTDGITWSAPNRSLSDWLGNVTYLNGRFIAAGGNGLRVRSLDKGATWSAGAGHQTVHYRDITNNGTIAVAVGHTHSATPNVGIVSSTTDGITWTERKRGGQHLGRVVAGNGTFVAAGNAGGISRSTNGTTWTDQTLLSGGGQVELAWTGTEFIATVGGKHFRSTDGVTWSSSTAAKPVHGMFNGRYLSLGWPAQIHASSNLTAWSQVFYPQGSGLTRFVVGEIP